MFIRKTKKYLILGGVLIFSIVIGTGIFFTSLNKNIQIENGVYAVEQEKQSKSEYTIEDIVNLNKIITEKIETETEKIPYETVTIGSASRNAKATILTSGKDGTQKITYKVRYEDNVATDKVKIKSTVSKQPVSEVVKYEVASNVISRDGQTTTRNENIVAPVSGYTKVIDMRFTSYCLCKSCTGKSPGDKGYGVTASGYVITPGNNERVVAVDPSVIPLGSRVYVQGLNGTPDYGYALAADKGGAIKGNKIDLYVDEHGSGPWWTVGKVRVYVLE